ncbi:MAG: copper-binding protein plastocyanin/azurin family [Cyanobacteria bacterium RYN_339]|nr:copper-binding protein plastocyanin/azurin family [Cyanobacteria bacterium RYN_339]
MRAPGFWFAVGVLMLTGCPNNTAPVVKASTKPKASSTPAVQASPSPSATATTKASASPTSSPTASPSAGTGTPSPSPSASATTGTGASPTPSASATATATPTASPTATPTPGLTATVDIKDFSFTPNALTIKVGGTVTFTNKGVTSHTVSPVSGLAFQDTDAITAGTSKSIKFTTAGTASYQCSFHTAMKGTITVVP